MHLTDADLGAALDSSAENAQATAARMHASECAVCRIALVEARAQDRDVGALLRYLDHPVPALDLASVAARSDTPHARRVMHIVRDAGDERRAGNAHGRAARIGVRRVIIALACGAVAAAAAVPSSPVRRIVARMVAPRSVPQVAAVPAALPSPTIATPPPAAPRGVAIVAGRHLEIAFRAPDPLGELRIHPGARDEVTVTATGDGAAYTVAAERLVVDNRSATGLTYDIDLPVRAAGADLSIRVGDRVVFARHGMAVITAAPIRADGTYTLRMAGDAHYSH